MDKYIWNCERVEIKEEFNQLNNVVYNVVFSVKLKNKDTEITDSIILKDPETDTFIEFDDLDNDIVTGWVKEQLGEEKIKEVEKTLNKKNKKVKIKTAKLKNNNRRNNNKDE